MVQFIDLNNIFVVLLLVGILSFNKRFLRGILTIFEISLVLGIYYFFLSHYKDIAILNMIVAYNPVETVLGLFLRLNLKPSGAFSQFAGFTIKEVIRIIILAITSRIVSPVLTHIYRIREALIKAFSEIGFTHLEETYKSLCA